MNDNRHQAISDCKYALSLSETALQQHLYYWLHVTTESSIPLYEEDQEYMLTLKEIQDKLQTNECLLKQESNDEK